MQCLLTIDEFGPTPDRVKTALLAYDKVILQAPDDRDFVPQTTGSVSVFRHAQPQRPMAKTAGYDERFAELTESLGTAIDSGLVEIRRSHPAEPQGGLYLGSGPSFPVNPNIVRDYFRAFAEDVALLSTLVDDDLRRFIDTPEGQGMEVAEADGGKQKALTLNLPLSPLPYLEGNFSTEQRRVLLTLGARSRLAAVIKVLALAGPYDAVPALDTDLHQEVMAKICGSANRFVDQVLGDPYQQKANLTSELVIQHFCDPTKLAACSFDYIVAQRQRGNASIAAIRADVVDRIHVWEADDTISLQEFRTKIDEHLSGCASAFRGFEEKLSGIGLSVGMKWGGGIGTAALSAITYPAITPWIMLAGAFAVMREAGTDLDKALDIIRASRVRTSKREVALFRNLSAFR